MPKPIDNPVVAAIPGGGWRVQHKNDDGTVLDSPILAWVFHADGTCKPVDVDTAGWCDEPTGDSNFLRIYHPGEEPESAGQPTTTTEH